MANLTLVVDNSLLKKARKYAVEHDTSVNRMVREFLEQKIGTDEEYTAAIEGIKSSFGKGPDLGPEGITWTRDELYRRR